MKFYIAIPVYKAEAFLSECISSVLSQTCQDFEIVLVDDGSPGRPDSRRPPKKDGSLWSPQNGDSLYTEPRQPGRPGSLSGCRRQPEAEGSGNPNPVHPGDRGGPGVPGGRPGI